MAKIIDYPRASLKSCLEVAVAVDSLGGKCSIEMAADKLNKKISGAWQALVSSTIRYGLITNSKGFVEITPLYRDYKLGYNESETRAALNKAFLMPPLFKAIADRFNGKELPISHFEKLLIREFHVPEDSASRVAKYFLDGSKQTGLLDSSGIINTGVDFTNTENSNDDETEITQDEITDLETDFITDTKKFDKKPDEFIDSARFSVRIMGPGMDSLILINDEEDLLIIKAMLKKIEKKFQISEDENTK